MLAALSCNPAAASIYSYADIDVGAGNIYGTGLNNGEQTVVGYNDTGAGDISFVKTGNSTAVISTAIPHASIEVHGVNNTGISTGSYLGSSNLTHGFKRLSDGTFTSFDITGAAYTAAYDINNQNAVVGLYKDSISGPSQGFFLSSAGITTRLNAPGATNTTLTGLNDLGQLVGFGDTAGSTFSFTYDLTTTAFNSVAYPTAGSNTKAYGINNFGQVVGYYTNASGTHGFVETQGIYETIDNPNGQNTQLYGIDDNGDLSGSYTDGNGNRHGFVATNVPEPASLLLILPALALALYRRTTSNSKTVSVG